MPEYNVKRSGKNERNGSQKPKRGLFSRAASGHRIEQRPFSFDLRGKVSHSINFSEIIYLQLPSHGSQQSGKTWCDFYRVCFSYYLTTNAGTPLYSGVPFVFFWSFLHQFQLYWWKNPAFEKFSYKMWRAERLNFQVSEPPVDTGGEFWKFSEVSHIFCLYFSTAGDFLGYFFGRSKK